MADGTVLIDSKLDTSGIKTGAADIQSTMATTAIQAQTTAKKIENAFKDVNYKDAFDNMPLALQQAYVKIESIRANDTLSAKQQADQIAKVYEDLGYTQEQASAIAWQAMEKDGTEGSKIIIQALQNVQDAAEQSGEGVVASFSGMDKTAKLLAAQTKAVASAMEAAGDKQGALSVTSKGLNQQLDVQKQKLAALKTSMELVTAEYGENSNEAIEVNTEMAKTKEVIAKLEAEISDTDDKLREMAKGLDDVGESAEDAGDKADDASISLGDLLGIKIKGDLVVSALKKIASACKEVISQSIDAAKDMQAMEAQFKQTFKGVEDTATKALNAISSETSISVTRMQSSFTKIFAFTKSVGGETAEAMDIAERAMRVAADSAAYYDRALDDVTDSLQSFLKGNYENDAALGIAATETTRNAMANELYAKSFKDLTEAQKVDTLLAMVEAGNEASGALGQAAREADQWENVQGELNNALDLLLARIGSPILTAITPIVQSITSAVKELATESASEKLTSGLKDYKKQVEAANKTFEESSHQIELNAIRAELYAETLEELAPLVSTSAEAQAQYANAVEQLNELYPDLNLLISEETGLLDENSQAQLVNLEAMKARALQQAMETQYADILNAQAEAILAVRQAEVELSNVQNQEEAIIQRLISTTGVSRERIMELVNAYKAYGSSVVGIGKDNNKLLADLANLTIEENRLKNGIDKGTAKIEEQDDAIEALAESYGFATEAVNKNVEAQDSVVEESDKVVEAVDEIRKSYDEAKEDAAKSIDSQISGFNKLKDTQKLSATEIVANLGSQKKALDEYSANLSALVDMGYPAELTNQFTDFSDDSRAAVAALANATPEEVAKIVEAFEEVEKSKEVTSGAMADLNTDASGKLNDLKNEFSASFEGISTKGKTEIDKLQKYINGLQGKTVYVDIVSRTSSGGSYSNKYTTPSLYSGRSVDAPAVASLPMLASGAVIPPNAPFAAILGDQKSGTNIEAPLSMIQEAVAEVTEDMTGGMMAGLEAILAECRSLRGVVENIEIGDAIIGQAAQRYERRKAIIDGV